MGRNNKPIDYEERIRPRLAEIEKLSETLVDASLASVLGISKRILSRLKKDHPELMEAIERGKLKRSSKYKTVILPNLAKISDMYQTMTETEIAQELGISRATWTDYKATHEELWEALQRGRAKICSRVKAAMLAAAEGDELVDVREIQELDENGNMIVTKIEKVTRKAKKDVVAQHLLLKNYDETWRNDDFETMELKKKQVDIAQKKADASEWS